MMGAHLYRLFFGTFRRRLIFSVAAVHAVLMTVFILDLARRHRIVIRERQSEHVAASVNSLASVSTSWMAAKDLAGLQELVESQGKYPGLRYAMLLDESGRVLAHTDPIRVGQYLHDLPPLSERTILTQRGTLLEGISSVATSGHHLGWARVGIDQAATQTRLNAVTQAGMLYSLLAIAVGSLLAWFLGTSFTRRLSVLQSVMRKVKEGESQLRADMSGIDETAELASGFNDMIERLERREAELLRANAALSESGAENRALLSAIPDLIFTNRRDGVYLAAHVSNPDLLLLPTEAFLHKKVLDVLPSPLAENFLKAFSDALDQKAVQELNYILPIGGQERCFEARIAPCDEDTVITIVRDVSERRRAEEALMETEERFNTAFHFSPVALGVTTLNDGLFLTVNKAFEDIYGYSDKELQGRCVGDIGLWVSAEVREKILALLAKGQPVRGHEVQVRRKDGTTCWVSYSGQLVTMRGIPCLLSGAIDITDRKQAEARLIESEAHLRAIIENEPECIKIVDGAGRLLQMNPAGLEMIQADSLEQVAGAPVAKLIAPEHQEAYQQMHERVLAGESLQLEYEVVGLKGRRLWLQTHAVPMLDCGQVVHLAVTRDITARKAAEAEKTQLEAQLHQAQKMESLGSLAGGVAHDMNNVLGAILGLASASIESQPLGTPARHAFETIIKAAERGGKMVKGLLNLARQRPAEEGEVDLNTILREEVGLLERTTLSKIRLNLELAEDLRSIRGDAGALSHAVMNLCVNAVDAMTENGTLTLRTRNVGKDWVEVQVEDTGCGMTRDVLEKALDPFFTTKGVDKGTGLGLSIVYSTVQVHRGKFEFQSEPGRGTRVTMRFPACESIIADPGSAGNGQTTVSPSALTVLVVDDDELIRSSMQMMLEALGHTTIAVNCGEAALQKLEEGSHPDVVILDMNMPGLGGAGTLPRLRALRPALPVLLATGRADHSALHLLEVDAGTTLLTKPFTLGELKKHLEALASEALSSP